jgi:hypothetical protein
MLGHRGAQSALQGADVLRPVRREKLVDLGAGLRDSARRSRLRGQRLRVGCGRLSGDPAEHQ